MLKLDEKFDFDGWMDLARRDPQQFERARTLAIADACTRMASDKRLIAGWCWRIDMERTRCRTPLQTCLRLSAMMWKSFFDLDHRLSHAECGTPASAQVLPLIRQEKV